MSPDHIPDKESETRSVESESIPFVTTSFTGKKALVLAPHPDDESLACGGSIALHRAAGDAVKIIFLTDGAKARTVEPSKKDAYVRLRETEARSACAILGVLDYEFWRLPDRSLKATTELSVKLATVISEEVPEVIYCLNPWEFHPDHREAAALLTQALRRTSVRPEILLAECNRPMLPNILVDITTVVGTKRKACDAYASQLEIHPYTEITIGLNRFRSLTLSDQCSHAEAFFRVAAFDLLREGIGAFGKWQCHLATGDSFLPPPLLPPDEALVSVIIRTRDRRNLLLQALESVASQTYRNLEVVVVVDGGDFDEAWLERFRGRLRCKIERHVTPRGRAAAANTGLSSATGKYVNFLDDDDLLYPEHLSHLAGYLNLTGEAVAYSDCEMADFQWRGGRPAARGKPEPFHGVDFSRERLLRENFLPIMVVMFSRELAMVEGGFDESFELLEDWDFWLRLSLRAAFNRVPGVTALYRKFRRSELMMGPWIPRIYQKHGVPVNDDTPARLNDEIARLSTRIAELKRENFQLRAKLSTNPHPPGHGTEAPR